MSAPDGTKTAEELSSNPTEELGEPATPESVPRQHLGFLLAALVMAAGALWLLPLSSSLWLDETATFWVVQGGLHQTIHRALEFQSGSVPYFLVAWIARVLGGTSEIALRMPSVIAACVATLLLYRLGKRLLDREAALLAGIVFVASAGVAFHAADARPYALALAFLVASTLALVRWLDRRRTRDLIAYAVLAALTVYTHYLFAVAILAHVPYAVYRLRSRGRRWWLHLLTPFLLVAVLLLPTIPHLVFLSGRSGLYSVPRNGTIGDWFSIVFPPVLVGSAVAGIAIGRLFGPLTLSTRPASPGTLGLLASGLFVPPVVLFTISLFGSSLLAPRYFVSTLPALALLVGWGLRTIGPPRARAIAATTVVVVALLSTGGLQHSSASQEVSYEDWRGAARAEQTIVGNTHIPVLVHTAYVESARISWLTRLETRSYLLSPLSIYPMTGRIIAMPYTLDGPAYAYLQGIMDRILVHAKRFLLVTRYPFVPYRTWLDGRLGPLGYRSRLVGTYGTIEIILFQR